MNKQQAIIIRDRENLNFHNLALDVRELIRESQVFDDDIRVLLYFHISNDVIFYPDFEIETQDGVIFYIITRERNCFLCIY